MAPTTQVNDIFNQDLLMISPSKVTETVSKLEEILEKSLGYPWYDGDREMITFDEALAVDTQMRSILERIWQYSSDYCFARNLEELKTKFEKFKDEAMYEYDILRTCECGIFYVCKVNGKKSYSCSCDIKETDDIRSGIYTQVNMFKKTKCYYLDKFFHPYNYEILDYFMLHLDLLSTCRIKIENERGCKKENKYINEDMDGDGDVWTFIAIVYLDIMILTCSTHGIASSTLYSQKAYVNLVASVNQVNHS